MTRLKFFNQIRNVARRLSHRALGSSAVLANEFYYAGIDFSILNQNSSSRDQVLDNHYRGRQHTAPIVLVPAGQVQKLEFLNSGSQKAFLRGDIVQVTASQGDGFDPKNYARHWTNRFAQRNVTALLPKTIHLLQSSPTRARRFELGRDPEGLVHQGLLDTTLFNATIDVRDSKSPLIVYCITFAPIAPAFMRVFTLSVRNLVVQR